MQNRNNSLGESLIGSIWDDNNIKDLTTELAETGLDIILKDGIVKDMPIVGIFAKLFAVGNTVRDRIFIKKIALFLEKATKLSMEEREAFRKKYEENKEYRKKFGEELILLLEKHETFEKSAILGGFFKAYVQGKITLDNFRAFAFAIDRIYLDDLKSLAYQRSKSPFLSLAPNSLKERLSPSGLASLNFAPAPISDRARAFNPQPSKLWFEINKMGELFASILLEVMEVEKRNF